MFGFVKVVMFEDVRTSLCSVKTAVVLMECSEVHESGDHVCDS